LQEFINSLTTIVSNIRFIDIVDILIVAFIFYKLMTLIRETRAEQLVKGLVILLVALKLSEWMKMYVLHFILVNTMTIGVVALIIVFQPELRRALEYIGRTKFLTKSIVDLMDEELNSTIDEIVKAVTVLSKARTGALIVMERDTGLGEIIETGTRLEALISSVLLLNIFEHNAPLHDGAIVIRKNKISAAGCFLPLTGDNSLNKDLGTRHRAAIGIAEQSDALTIVVSEETGAISVAQNGKLQRFLDTNTLKSIIKNSFKREEMPTFLMKRWKVKNENDKSS
jgi:diadenylate cyclase